MLKRYFFRILEIVVILNCYSKCISVSSSSKIPPLPCILYFSMFSLCDRFKTLFNERSSKSKRDIIYRETWSNSNANVTRVKKNIVMKRYYYCIHLISLRCVYTMYLRSLVHDNTDCATFHLTYIFNSWIEYQIIPFHTIDSIRILASLTNITNLQILYKIFVWITNKISRWLKNQI